MRFATSKSARGNEMKWTVQEMEDLRRMYREGAPLKEMAKVFNRSGSAIQDKARRQWLNRPPKIRKDGRQWVAGIAAPNSGSGNVWQTSQNDSPKTGQIHGRRFTQTEFTDLEVPELAACKSRGIDLT